MVFTWVTWVTWVPVSSLYDCIVAPLLVYIQSVFVCQFTFVCNMFILIKCIVYDEINQYQFNHLVLQSSLTGLLIGHRISKWNSYLPIKELSLILSEWWFSDLHCNHPNPTDLEAARWWTQNAIILTKRRHDPNEEWNRLSVEQTIKDTVTSVKPQCHQKSNSTYAPSRHQNGTSPTPPPNSTKKITLKCAVWIVAISYLWWKQLLGE